MADVDDGANESGMPVNFQWSQIKALPRLQ